MTYKSLSINHYIRFDRLSFSLKYVEKSQPQFAFRLKLHSIEISIDRRNMRIGTVE